MSPLFRRTLLAILCAAPAFILSSPAAADWRPVGPFGGMVTVLAVEPATSTVLAGTGSDGLFRSRDHGETWQPVGDGSYGVFRIVFDPRHRGTVYAVQGRFLQKSTNSGRSWGSVSLPYDDVVAALAIDPRRSILYASFAHSLYK